MKKGVFYSSTQSFLFKDSGIKFIITSRQNGFSLAPYDSLNLAYHTGDDNICVTKNRGFVREIFAPQKPLLSIDQFHSDTIIETVGTYFCDEILGKADGLICSGKNVACMVLAADCNLVLIYAPNISSFALLHAGRAGVVQKILTKSIQTLVKKGANISDMILFISPSIRKCCYEISPKLAENFSKTYLITEGIKPKLDLITLILDELKQCNIFPQQIEISHTCTCCEKKLFSYRREGITGRFGLVAMLQD